MFSTRSGLAVSFIFISCVLYSLRIANEYVAQAALFLGFSFSSLFWFSTTTQSTRQASAIRAPSLWLIVLSTYVALHTIIFRDSAGIIRIAQCVAALVAMTGAAYVAAILTQKSALQHRRQEMKKVIIFLCEYTVLAILLYAITQGAGDAKNRYAYSLYFAFMAFEYWIFLADLRKERTALVSAVMISITVGFLTDTRAISTYGILIVFFWFISNLPFAGKYLARKSHIPLFILMLLYTLFYEQIAEWIDVTVISNAHSGRTALSGRQLIWPEFLATFYSSPFFGSGPSGIPDVENLHGYKVSAHNFYLQYCVEYGVVGMGILLGCLKSSWNLIARKGSVSTFSSVMMLLIAASNMNEVLLLENMFYVGMCQWIIIGMAIAGSSRLKPSTSLALNNSLLKP